MRARLGCRKVVGGASEGEWRWGQVSLGLQREEQRCNKKKKKKKQMLLLDGKKEASVEVT